MSETMQVWLLICFMCGVVGFFIGTFLATHRAQRSKMWPTDSGTLGIPADWAQYEAITTTASQVPKDVLTKEALEDALKQLPTAYQNSLRFNEYNDWLSRTDKIGVEIPWDGTLLTNTETGEERLHRRYELQYHWNMRYYADPITSTHPIVMPL